MSEWQPIETAPKQIGCEILAIGVNDHSDQYYDIVSWQGHEWKTFDPETDQYSWPVEPPTHWMPLPSPPSSEPASGSNIITDGKR
jgi:hypothetical protein